MGAGVFRIGKPNAGPKPPDQVVCSEETQGTMIVGLTGASGSLFIASMSAFALLLIDVPYWPSLLVLLALAALFLGLLLWFRRNRKRRSRSTSPQED
jgi:hypothetical protein